MSNPQLNKSKSGIKWNCIKCVDDSNDENNFSRKLLLTNKQVSRLHKAFANNSSANIK